MFYFGFSVCFLFDISDVVEVTNVLQADLEK